MGKNAESSPCILVLAMVFELSLVAPLSKQPVIMTINQATFISDGSKNALETGFSVVP